MKTYIYANGQILAQHDRDTSANRYFYLHDRLGSVRQVIDTGGDVQNHYTYEPFGRLFAYPDSVENIVNPFKFAGQWYDSEFGQYYLRARQYDPYLGNCHFSILDTRFSLRASRKRRVRSFG